jgi:diguanylate cyclase (GGDEF)-like protein
VRIAATLGASWRLPRVEQIGADQIVAIVRATPAALLGSVVNATIVAISFCGSVAPAPLLFWYVASLFVAAQVGYRWTKNRGREVKAVSPKLIRRSTFVAILLALPWAVLVTSYLGKLQHTDELVLIALCAGMSASGSIYLAPVFPAALAYMITIVLPATIKCLLLVSSGYGLLGCLVLSYGGFLFAVIATNAGLSIEKTQALTQLREKLLELDKSKTTLEQLATHDLLTGLRNRLGFANDLDRACYRLATPAASNFALLCLDLDRFKMVNDTFGHPVGDLLLKAVAKRLQRCAREGDVVARIGGDEFAFIQRAPQGGDGVEVLARRIVEVLSAPFHLQGHIINVGTCIGIVLAPTDDTEPGALLKKADLALYRAKAEKRGAFCFFEEAMLNTRGASEISSFPAQPTYASGAA